VYGSDVMGNGIESIMRIAVFRRLPRQEELSKGRQRRVAYFTF
jgi:hypothetical protein